MVRFDAVTLFDSLWVVTLNQVNNTNILKKKRMLKTSLIDIVPMIRKRLASIK